MATGKVQRQVISCVNDIVRLTDFPLEIFELEIQDSDYSIDGDDEYDAIDEDNYSLDEEPRNHYDAAYVSISLSRGR